MTKLQIISKLWSAIYDLVFLVKGTPTKSLEEIEADLDVIEYACRRYADCDDDEIAISSEGAASVPEKKNTPSYTAGHEYTLQVELKVRTGPGTNYSAKKHSQLTADGQKHDRDNDGCLDAGTVVTCQEVRNVGNDIWMKAPSGWMAAYYDGKVYIK